MGQSHLQKMIALFKAHKGQRVSVIDVQAFVTETLQQRCSMIAAKIAPCLHLIGMGPWRDRAEGAQVGSRSARG